MQDLGALGGSSCSEATGINALGQVTGNAFGLDAACGPMDSPRHAFRWTASGGMQDPGTLNGTWSSAAATNERGQVTGYAGVGRRRSRVPVDRVRGHAGSGHPRQELQLPDRDQRAGPSLVIGT